MIMKEKKEMPVKEYATQPPKNGAQNVIQRLYGSPVPAMQIFALESPNPQAKFAMACIERWGMVAGVPDGEDSAGRARVRLSTPEELVDRAFKIADLFFTGARQRDLMLSCPTIEEAQEMLLSKAAGE